MGRGDAVKVDWCKRRPHHRCVVTTMPRCCAAPVVRVFQRVDVARRPGRTARLNLARWGDVVEMHKAWPGIGNNEFPDAGASAGCLVGGDVLAEELVEQGLAPAC